MPLTFFRCRTPWPIPCCGILNLVSKCTILLFLAHKWFPVLSARMVPIFLLTALTPFALQSSLHFDTFRNMLRFGNPVCKEWKFKIMFPEILQLLSLGNLAWQDLQKLQESETINSEVDARCEWNFQFCKIIVSVVFTSCINLRWILLRNLFLQFWEFFWV